MLVFRLETQKKAWLATADTLKQELLKAEFPVSISKIRKKKNSISYKFIGKGDTQSIVNLINNSLSKNF